MKHLKYFKILSFFILFFIQIQVSNANEIETGRKLFSLNCIACHKNGQNLIIPEKNLKKEALEANGMNTIDAIIYQVLNGKNGMPAFGGRLSEKEIEEIAKYVLKQSNDSSI